MTHGVRAVPVHFLITNGDLSLVAFARELDGIAEQIDKDLLEERCIGLASRLYGG